MSYYYRFGLIVIAAVLYAAPLGAAESAYEPTEFLARWDRRYRLIDPDVEMHGGEEKPDYAAAAAELKDGIVTGIPDEEMYYRLGFCYEKLGDYDRALEAYSSASTALAGRSGGALEYYIPYHIGIANARQGRYVAAADAFKRALRFPRVSAAARNNLGFCYNKLSLKRKAIEEFKNAAALNPRLAEAFLNMGNAQAELGDLWEAAASLQAAIKLQPDIPGGRYSLGLVQR
ncbi:MAG: tetratricopeptide repeat protein, partial [bacterium]